MPAKIIKFNYSVQLLVEYFAWRESLLTAKQILRLIRMWSELNMEAVCYIFSQTGQYVNFMPRLRQLYPQFTAVEAIPLYNLLVIQNRWPENHSLLTQLDDGKNANFCEYYPQIAQYAVRGKKVETSNSVLVAAKAAPPKKRGPYRKRLRVESIPELFGSRRTANRSDSAKGHPEPGYYPDQPV